MVTNGSLPSPPADDIKPTMSRKQHITSKSLKPQHRISKSTSSSAASVHHDHLAHSVGMDGRHKRVWKACERCRMKKTKCDGEFPCKRCKDDGLICAAGVRKKMEYKQLPKGYAEVLENTQFALVATVHKLYFMLRNNQPWELGEPELNEHGEPVIHNIAQKLGCIRPISEWDLPGLSIFPENRAGMAELARQLEEQQRQQQQHDEAAVKSEPMNSIMGSPMYNPAMDRASSSELDYSDFEFHSYRRAAFGGNPLASGNTVALSPQSLAGSLDLDLSSQPTPGELPANVGLFPPLSSVGATSFADWTLARTVQHHQDEMAFQQLLRQPGLLHTPNVNRELLESVNFGIIRPNMLSANANPGLVMGTGDPTIYDGYDEDAMNL